MLLAREFSVCLIAFNTIFHSSYRPYSQQRKFFFSFYFNGNGSEAVRDRHIDIFDIYIVAVSYGPLPAILERSKH